MNTKHIWRYGCFHVRGEGLSACIGSVIGGLLQARVLPSHASRASWWVVATVVSWGLAWSLGLAGGIALGAVGGGVLIWLLGAPIVGQVD